MLITACKSMHYSAYMVLANLPDVTTSFTSFPSSLAMKPKMEKMTNPAKKLVNLFAKPTIKVSLKRIHGNKHNNE